jgi:hypothetical protein
VLVAHFAPQAITVTYNKGLLTLSWNASTEGFTLESTGSLKPPVQWTAVSGVVNNRIVIPVQSGARFYRLRK